VGLVGAADQPFHFRFVETVHRPPAYAEQRALEVVGPERMWEGWSRSNNTGSRLGVSPIE
jgi:hypothetical protein